MYESLTGRPPFKAETWQQTVIQLLRDDPVPPVRLNSRVPPDLNTICLKCLEKEPRKRYLSAAVLADDLASFRNGDPIQAKPVSRVERLWRWCRQKPLAASLAAALLLALVGGMAGVFGQWQRAEANYRDAEQHRAKAEEWNRSLSQVVNYFGEEAGDIGEQGLSGRSVLLRREQWLKGELENNRRFLAEQRDDPWSRAELARTHYHVGRSLIAPLPLGAPAHDRPERAREQFEAALAIQRELVCNFPSEPRFPSDLAATLNSLADLLIATGQPGNSLPYAEEALQVLERLASEAPANPEYQSSLGHAWHNLGRARLATDGWVPSAAARSAFLRAITHQRRAFDSRPEASDYKRLRYRKRLSDHYLLLHQVLFREGRLAEAFQANRERRELWPDDSVELYNVACSVAWLAGQVKEEETARLAKRIERAVYQATALEILEDLVVHRDFLITKSIRDRPILLLRYDEDLNPVRELPRFKQLLERAELKEQAFEEEFKRRRVR